MDAMQRILADIPAFAGYEEEAGRRSSDEQVRAFVGEALASLPRGQVDEKLLLRCEFLNQHAFHLFNLDPRPDRIAAVLAADAALLDAVTASDFDALERAFDERDAAMQRG